GRRGVTSDSAASRDGQRSLCRLQSSRKPRILDRRRRDRSEPTERAVGGGVLRGTPSLAARRGAARPGPPPAASLPPTSPRATPAPQRGGGGRGARRRRWLSRRWRRLRSDGAPARPSSSSPPKRRSAAWTSTPSPASLSTCCARRPPAGTISTSGVRVRTAYLFCSSRRITSLPVGKRHSMKYWKKSSNPSDLIACCLLNFTVLFFCSRTPSITRALQQTAAKYLFIFSGMYCKDCL
uniref:Maturin, neural progenitor differentiation regulator homolog n=1 Tax=Coturnix japonica TaxID=93934 RepID=A0A8C2TQ43_COTJA